MPPQQRIGATPLAAMIGDISGTRVMRYLVLAEQIESMVADGRIVPGTRIPSERALSEALAVSRTTVASSYQLLRDRGCLQTLPGSGSVVTVPPPDARAGEEDRPAESRRKVPWWRPIAEREIDLTMAAMAAPSGELERATNRAVAEFGGHLYGTGYEPAGTTVLRDQIAAWFHRRGVPTEREQILVTSGALHAVDLVVRSMLGPGERLLTPVPTYPGVLDVVRNGFGRMLPVALGDDGGFDATQIVTAIRQGYPKLAYLVPDFHNPTGALMSEAARQEVLATARASTTTVLIDESYVGLGFTDTGTPCAAIDPDVITVGGLSKAIWGGLRIGWVRASREQIDRLVGLRTGTGLGGPILEELIAVELMPELDRILEGRVRELRRNAAELMQALRRELPEWRFYEPDGGLSLWVQMDAPGAAALTLAVRELGVRLAPGSRFGVQGTLDRYLRIPFTLPADDLREAVTRIASAWKRLDRERPVRVEQPRLVA
jgi:DNA-binding transcriptional MocR family regulator